jgi:hypothetical protein
MPEMFIKIAVFPSQMNRRSMLRLLPGIPMMVPTIASALIGNSSKDYRFYGYDEITMRLLFPYETAYDSYASFISSQYALQIPGREPGDHPLGVDLVWNFYKPDYKNPIPGFHSTRMRPNELFFATQSHH